MSAPVDLIAVLDDAARQHELARDDALRLGHKANADIHESALGEARAAIAAVVELAVECCCGCGRRADGPSFSTPHDACNRYRGGKTVRWAAECWRRNVEWCERLRAEQDAANDERIRAALARCEGGAA